VFSLKAPRFATNRRVLATAGESIERFLTSGVMELKDKLGPINWQFMATKKFDPADFEAFLDLLPKAADGRELRHVVEVRHDSFRSPDLVAMTRSRGIAIAIAGDGGYPQIADPTASFIYARIMGTREDEAAGYSPEALDRWTVRAKAWASGQIPDGLDLVTTEPPPQPRDVYLYVISGHKPKNPAAALALIERTR